MGQRLTAAVKYCPVKERVGDWMGYCLEDENLKVRAPSKEKAWELIEELIADVIEANEHAEKLRQEFNDQWQARINF